MKVLIIRFSSIGDIVLTTPVIRSLHAGLPDVEIHFLTKAANHTLLAYNPYLTQIHLLEGSLRSTITTLKDEHFDHILDLHKNVRSWQVKQALGKPSATFSKENWAKYKMTRFKARNIVLDHVVDRYGATLASLGLTLDGKGLDFFLPPQAEAEAQKLIADRYLEVGEGPLLAVALGASYKTKRWVTAYFPDLLNAYRHPVILLGGPDTKEEAYEIEKSLTIPCLNVVGKADIPISAALMKQCRAVLTHDTGFMHIAAAFHMPIYSLWGNTVPEFGMTPYKTPHEILEVKGLNCRPCSKLGFEECPNRHFACMTELKPEVVLERMKSSSL